MDELEKIYALKMQQITKAFGGVPVLDHVDFDLTVGETHALVGANGAGKSTLMKIIDGIYVNYEGELWVRDRKAHFKDPVDAQNSGIAMIHQELDLVTNLDVASNIYMGRETIKRKAGKILDRGKMLDQARDLLISLSFDIDADEITGRLSPAQQQQVLIARCVAMDASIIIMDEPTSSLSFKETEELFHIIGRLKKLGKSIIYISHFLEEIFRVADRITVLRDGRKIATLDSEGCTIQQIVDLMVGKNRNLSRKYFRETLKETPVLEVRNLSRQKGLVEDISFTVHEGEVVGIAGVVGSGRTELVKTIFGADRKKSGAMFLHGNQVHIKNPAVAVNLGITLVPENRKEEGIILKRSVGDNLSIAAYKYQSQLGVIDYKKAKKDAEKMMDFMHVVSRGQHQDVATLSGGNQQKVVIGKWLNISPKVLLLDQPTRGIDVGAKNEIYELINALAENGASIVLVSDELEELINLSDRVIVMQRGRIVKEFNNSTRSLTKAELLESMVGSFD